MKHLAKFVAVVLLIALSAIPEFAAIPCQQSVHSMPCCGGTLCPMMAKMLSSQASSHRGVKDVPAPCCKTHAHPFVAVTDHKSIDGPIANANYDNVSAISSARFEQFIHEEVPLVNPRRAQQTQAMLSTFLI